MDDINELKDLLTHTIERAIDQETAAVLTLAVQVRKATAAYRNELRTDDELRAEIHRMFFQFFEVANREASQYKAREANRRSGS